MHFRDLHPFTLIIYFASVITFTIITMNPVSLLLSFIGALCAVAVINKRTDLHIYLVLFVFISLTNPIFSHNGETVLFFMFGQRITLEAFIYGIATGILIISVIYWFKLFSAVFTEDKLTWLIGKISPKLCVVFTMSLRFLPLFKENAKNIYNAQLSMGVFNTDTFKGKLDLMKNVFSALISLSSENAIETADTMRSRGFGNKKRSVYSFFAFSKRDLVVTLICIAADLLLIYFLATGSGKFFYYPSIRFVDVNIFFYITYALLCFLPVINDSVEVIRWKYLISKI